jgi:hypothetical protein
MKKSKLKCIAVHHTKFKEGELKCQRLKQLHRMKPEK